MRYKSRTVTKLALLVLLALQCLLNGVLTLTDFNMQEMWTPSEDSWNYWWTYSGVSGPTYWGLLNLDWFMCDRGRKQSPINIETRSLVYDPHLSPLKVDNNLVSGFLYNDGHAIVFNASKSVNLLIESKRENILKTFSETKVNNSIQLIRKRQLQINDLFSAAKADSLDDAISPKSTSTLLKDLSKSVELSISQMNDGILNESGDSSEKLFAANEFGVDSNGAANNEPTNVDDSNIQVVQLTGAGLAYPFKFEALFLRFGLDNSRGSEHLINSHAYSAEMQLIFYNSLLYKSYTEASLKPNGLLAISVLIDTLPPITNETRHINESTTKSALKLNEPLESLLTSLSKIKNRGATVILRNLNLSALLPDSEQFVSYDGSLTMPACHENVNWLILNKPLYITQSSLDSLRTISADEPSSTSSGTLIAGNLRPIQPTNDRLIRTNIKPKGRGSNNQETCSKIWTKYEYRETKTHHIQTDINRLN